MGMSRVIENPTMLGQRRMAMKDDLPFASEPAETAYQAGLNAGIQMSRDQFRFALIAFVTADEKSKKEYLEFRAKRVAEQSK